MTGAEVLARRQRVSAVSKLELSAEILVAYARARRVLRQRSLPAATAAMRRHSERHFCAAEDAHRIGLRLGRAVTRVLGVLPRDPRCLTRSLVLTALLARRGILASLVIGVRPDPFGAHAWVEHEGRPLLPPATEPFERLLEV
jgi:Transglutaminase-like superfamily